MHQWFWGWGEDGTDFMSLKGKNVICIHGERERITLAYQTKCNSCQLTFKAPIFSSNPPFLGGGGGGDPRFFPSGYRSLVSVYSTSLLSPEPAFLSPRSAWLAFHSHLTSTNATFSRKSSHRPGGPPGWMAGSCVLAIASRDPSSQDQTPPAGHLPIFQLFLYRDSQ